MSEIDYKIMEQELKPLYEFNEIDTTGIYREIILPKEIKEMKKDISKLIFPKQIIKPSE